MDFRSNYFKWRTQRGILYKSMLYIWNHWRMVNSANCWRRNTPVDFVQLAMFNLQDLYVKVVSLFRVRLSYNLRSFDEIPHGSPFQGDPGDTCCWLFRASILETSGLFAKEPDSACCVVWWRQMVSKANQVKHRAEVRVRYHTSGGAMCVMNSLI